MKNLKKILTTIKDKGFSQRQISNWESNLKNQQTKQFSQINLNGFGGTKVGKYYPDLNGVILGCNRTGSKLIVFDTDDKTIYEMDSMRAGMLLFL